ncbi:MAG: hypothetical protein U0L42_02280, partial [Methanobrevibacter sp.]|uniref:ribose-phosphate pyrophosphokinase-like domain-containing protein n=1 Tax=Methanobrevibacter sp. TaxID=66852 RepID=UPI002E75CA13
MIFIEEREVDINRFPDGTLLLKEDIVLNYSGLDEITLTWLYDSNEELVSLIFLVKHIRDSGIKDINLKLPYIPNARQDRVKTDEDVFTLKYFADVINWLEFKSVEVLDPHSSVSEALINNIKVLSPEKYILKAINSIEEEFTINQSTNGDLASNQSDKSQNLLLFYPDEGAMKRYSGMIDRPFCFGIKNRDWQTGKIKDLMVSGEIDSIKDASVLIVDDISSRGGTFYHSALKLKELGAKELY